MISLASPLLTVALCLPGSETPPEGPPWKTDFHEARAEALSSGKPIFLYFTKTY